LTILLAPVLVASVLTVHADTDKQDLVNMIELYEGLYDECVVRYSSESYTYQSYLLGDESKLEPRPRQASDLTITYSSMDRHQRVDRMYDLGEFNRYVAEVSDGERTISWNTTDYDSAGQAMFRPADEETTVVFPVGAFRPFHFNFARHGLAVEDLEVKRNGQDIILRWARADPENTFEMCYERWGEYLRPRWMKDLWVRDGEPDELLYERKYYYRDGVDESGKKSMQLAKMVDLAPVHDFCSYKIIEEVDLSPDLDSSSFELEFKEGTWLIDRSSGIVRRHHRAGTSLSELSEMVARPAEREEEATEREFQ